MHAKSNVSASPHGNETAQHPFPDDAHVVTTVPVHAGQERQSLVLMLTPDRQIDRRIMLQADTLQAQGMEVRILAMPPDQPVRDDPRVQRVGATAGVAGRENRVLDTYRWVRGHVPMNSALMRAMKRLAWQYLVDQETFYGRLFQTAVVGYRPRIVVAHDLPMLPLAAQLARDTGARLVYDSHELYCEQEFSARERRRWAEIEARHIGACDAVITVNRSIAGELQRRYGLAEVHVILNAELPLTPLIRTRYFHQRFGLSSDTRVLLLQGGLSAGRNLEPLVQAMVLLQDRSVALVLLGDGLLVNTLKARVQAAGLAKRVLFHPAVPQAELLTLTAAADAGVIPYQATCLNNHYCTPNKLFEFIAAAIPVLASDLPEISALVVGQDIGLVGAMDNAATIAVLIDQFFADPSRLSTWQDNLMRTRHTISWAVEGEKLLRIYRGLS